MLVRWEPTESDGESRTLDRLWNDSNALPPVSTLSVEEARAMVQAVEAGKLKHSELYLRVLRKKASGR